MKEDNNTPWISPVLKEYLPDATEEQLLNTQEQLTDFLEWIWITYSLEVLVQEKMKKLRPVDSARVHARLK